MWTERLVRPKKERFSADLDVLLITHTVFIDAQYSSEIIPGCGTQILSKVINIIVHRHRHIMSAIKYNLA